MCCTNVYLFILLLTIILNNAHVVNKTNIEKQKEKRPTRDYNLTTVKTEQLSNNLENKLISTEDKHKTDSPKNVINVQNKNGTEQFLNESQKTTIFTAKIINSSLKNVVEQPKDNLQNSTISNNYSRTEKFVLKEVHDQKDLELEDRIEDLENQNERNSLNIQKEKKSIEYEGNKEFNIYLLVIFGK